jgi:hypothetical protein
MTKLPIAIAFVLAATSAASAGGPGNSFGIGAEYQLSGIGGLSAAYNTSSWHAELALGFDDPKGPGAAFGVFAGFFYHVAGNATADFGVGGTVGYAAIAVPPAGMGGGGTNNVLVIEPGFQIRAFIVPNVALSFTGAATISVIDDQGFAVAATGIGGSGIFGLNGTVGVHYFF